MTQDLNNPKKTRPGGSVGLVLVGTIAVLSTLTGSRTFLPPWVKILLGTALITFGIYRFVLQRKKTN